MPVWLISLLTPIIKQGVSLLFDLVMDFIREEKEKRKTHEEVQQASQTGNTSSIESQLRGL